MITSTWCVLTLFAARPEFQACQSIKSKTVILGLQVGVAPMESLVSHTYSRKMGDFRVRNRLNTSLVSPTFFVCMWFSLMNMPSSSAVSKIR